MSRDFALIRQILLETEKTGGKVYTNDKDGPDVVYNAYLLIRSGHLRGKDFGEGAAVSGMEWEGHELLDAIRNDTVFNRTMEKVKRVVGSATLEVVKATAEGIARGMLKEPGQ